jgi:hypothetical protein
MARVAGVCYIKADGIQLEVKGGIEIPFSPVNRETVMGLAGNAGYKETAQRQYLKLTAVFTPDFPITTLANSTNMTVTAELANGKVFTLVSAYLEGETVSNGEEGTAEIEFTGKTGIWL